MSKFVYDVLLCDIVASGESDSDANHQDEGEAVVLDQVPRLAPPPMYKVVFLDDDFTPMFFVVEVLMFFFAMQKEQATQVMMEIHLEGRAAVGLYTRDVAETKAMKVVEYAQQHNHPLMCQIERA